MQSCRTTMMVLSVPAKGFFESHCGHAIPKPFFLLWKRMPYAAARRSRHLPSPSMSREVRSGNPANWVTERRILGLPMLAMEWVSSNSFGRRVQDVSVEPFDQLAAGDILFIDSSHNFPV